MGKKDRDKLIRAILDEECGVCEYSGVSPKKPPCSKCRQRYVSQFSPKK